jgi:hypothetical protein
MPKKTRKMKQRAADRRVSLPPVQSEVAGGESTGSAPLRDYSSRGLTPLTFDYSHIYSDLKRIALFAGFFFAVLVVLSFVIK